jgi:hypothetical protein
MANSNRPRPATLRSLGDGDVGLWVHYDDRHHAKALPGARWDKHLKCWRVPARFAHEAQAVVERLNGGLNVALVDALALVFRELPARLREPTYRALVKLWHPDVGGDTAATQALTTAWDQRPRSTEDLL